MLEIYLKLLKEFVSYRSISTDQNYKNDVYNTALWLKNLFLSKNFEVDLVEGYDNPIVIAKFNVSDKLDTVLIYGHYDVQPANKEEGWLNDPFDLKIDNNKAYARGVVDNKGQILVHIYSIFNLIEKGLLRYNVIFMIEGNEETGSPLLHKFIQDYSNKLKVNFVFFSDGELTMGYPTIESGFRGILNVTLKIITSIKDNHSGLYGGSIPNAALVLSQLISKMYDVNNVLDLPGLNNTLENADPKILQDVSLIPFDEGLFLSNTGVAARLNKNLNFYLQTGYLTSAEITTLNAGYLGAGYRNAIPGVAIAKINFRVSPNHKTSEIIHAFKQFLQNNLPSYARFELDLAEGIEPISIDLNNKYVFDAKSIASVVYGKDCYFKLCGAIVPIAGLFQDILKIPVISLGLGNEDCNMHGVNENFDLNLLKKGLEFSNIFFSKDF